MKIELSTTTEFQPTLEQTIEILKAEIKDKIFTAMVEGLVYLTSEENAQTIEQMSEIFLDMFDFISINYLENDHTNQEVIEQMITALQDLQETEIE